MTLLEEAKKITLSLGRRGEVTDEEIELFLAYLKGELRVSQVSKTLGMNYHGAAIYSRLVVGFVRAYEQGRIKIIDKHE